jgi:hypothetical protein
MPSDPPRSSEWWFKQRSMNRAHWLLPFFYAIAQLLRAVDGYQKTNR